MNRFPVSGDVVRILPEWDEVIVVESYERGCMVIPRDGPHTIENQHLIHIHDIAKDVQFLKQVKIKFSHSEQRYIIKGDN